MARPDGSRTEIGPRERESFILLQHLCTLSGARRGGLLDGVRMAEDLGFTPSAAVQLLDHLFRAGFLDTSVPGTSISITPSGHAYFERLAQRRKSVRSLKE